MSATSFSLSRRSVLATSVAAGAVSLISLQAQDATTFIQRTARDHSTRHTQLLVAALRSFFRFCIMSAISQNRPLIIEIKKLKTSQFKESKTAPSDLEETGSMGHVGCPQSELANNDLQPGRAWMVAATNSGRVGDQSRNCGSVSALGEKRFRSRTGHRITSTLCT